MQQQEDKHGFFPCQKQDPYKHVSLTCWSQETLEGAVGFVWCTLMPSNGVWEPPGTPG